MINALDELQDFQIMNSYNEDETQEMVVHLYLAVRLKPLLDKKKLEEQDIDTISNALANNYLEHDLSLDLMINAVYNYVNNTKLCPPMYQLNSSYIEKFLEDNYEE